MANLVKFGTTVQNDDYPYGRLRCTIFFTLEFAPKKGFRFVSQTINPKNGHYNAPKKSTYYDFKYLYIDENNHTKSASFSLNGGITTINQVCYFLSENADAIGLTPEQTKWICGRILTSLVISVAWMKVNVDEGKEYLKPYIKALNEGVKSGTMNFSGMQIDETKYNSYFGR